MRLCLVIIVVLTGASVFAGDETPALGAASAGTRMPVGMQVPDSFVVERIAGPPLVKHPISICLDGRGRMFVAEAAGLNLSFGELEKQLPNSIRMLEDLDGDGFYDRAVEFADKMTFPAGVLWHHGVLYSTSPPFLWKLEDADGDGKADKRTALVGKFGSTGNGADVHGPFLGPDGLLYFCDGRNGHDLARPDGFRAKGRAAGVYRCRPDGAGLERICAGGMDNPVEVAFTPAGEPIVCTNIVRSQPRADALLFATQGGIYPHDAPAIAELRGQPRLLPIQGDLGWVAVSSLIRCRSNHLGDEFQDQFLSAQFNTRLVQRHEWKRKAGGFEWRHLDFLSCSDPDFHPTCIREHPDGSLLLVDTGGWFRIGCPASQIAKPEIAGGIYRIRRRDRPLLEDPFGARLNWSDCRLETLVLLLGDSRPTVQDRAAAEISLLPQIDPAELRTSLRHCPYPLASRVVWAVARSGNDLAHAVVSEWICDDRHAPMADEAKIAAAASASVFRYRKALAGPLKRAISLDAKPSAALVRECAIALSRIDGIGPDRVPTELIETAAAVRMAAEKLPDDEFLENALFQFLLSSSTDAQLAEFCLADGAARTIRRAAFAALAQRDSERLTLELLLQSLNRDDERLRASAAAWLTSKPELSAEIQRWLSAQFSDLRRDCLETGADRMLETIVADAEFQRALATAMRRWREAPRLALSAIRAASAIPLRNWTADLSHSISEPLGADNAEIVSAALDALPADSCSQHLVKLLEIAGRQALSTELRLRALRKGAHHFKPMPQEAFALCAATVRSEEPPLLKCLAAESIARASLTKEQWEQVAELVASAGALELPILLPMFESQTEERLGFRLLRSLESAPGLASLSPEAIRRALAKFPESVLTKAGPILAKLEATLEEKRERILRVERLLTASDANRGKQVFSSPARACSGCHRIGNHGGQIGPELTKIGAIRAPRDLIESILFPSQSIARGYEAATIELTDGSVTTGILRNETPVYVEIALADQSVRRILRRDIETIAPSRLSIMPQGFDAQLSDQQLADLTAYLMSLK